MFRRRWSGLPADPVFPADLEKLGYFVNEDDEIRLISDPDFYFKYFISKNDRWNERQRFAMNVALEQLIHARLERQGLEKIRLPLGAAPDAPHVPIFASADLATRSRVVVIFGQSVQDLGVLAHRVTGGPGGVDRGSMVSVVRAIQRMDVAGGGAGEDGAPGIILANLGQLSWWPEGLRPLSPRSRAAIPLPSAVHWGRAYGPRQDLIPANEGCEEHVRYAFEEVIARLACADAKLDVIGVGDGADHVEMYLGSEAGWARWGARMGSLALLGGFCDIAKVESEGFKTFLDERARSYIPCEEPLGVPIAGPKGNPDTLAFTSYGCPVFSAGEPYLIEMLLVKAHAAVLEWIGEVVRTPGYRNPEVVVTFADRVETEVEWAEEEEEKEDAGGVGDATDEMYQGGEEPSVEELARKAEDLSI